MSWSGNKCIHHNIVAKTAAHHKQVENFVGAEEAVLLVKEWKLHGIDNATGGIDDATGKQPPKCLPWECSDDLSESEHADPAHGNVNKGRKPFRTVDPECIHENAKNRDPPYQGQQDPAGAVT